MGMCVERKGRRATLRPQAPLLPGLALAVMLLPGCQSVANFYDTRLPFDTPVDWWHQLQGGALGEERPPPPGVTDPYPDFGQLPARPAPTDPAARRALSARLSSERDRTARLAEQDPIEAPGPRSIPPQPAPSGLARSAGSPDASAAPPAAAPPPAAPPEAPMARLDAAEARPDAATSPPSAVPQASAGSAAATPQAASRRPGAPPVAPGDGALPTLPSGAPPLPTLPGIPATAFEPATPKPAPQVDADFITNSAVLRPASAEALRQLAARRAGGNVAVLGGGDARSALPDAQAAALPLAWRRARAIQDVLTSAGVPTAALRVDAAALARGGIARLVD